MSTHKEEEFISLAKFSGDDHTTSSASKSSKRPHSTSNRFQTTKINNKRRKDNSRVTVTLEELEPQAKTKNSDSQPQSLTLEQNSNNIDSADNTDAHSINDNNNNNSNSEPSNTEKPLTEEELAARVQRRQQLYEREKQLEALVFGGTSIQQQQQQQQRNEMFSSKRVKIPTPQEVLDDDDDDHDGGEDDDNDDDDLVATSGHGAAWEDEDDEVSTVKVPSDSAAAFRASKRTQRVATKDYQRQLRQQFETSSYQSDRWAQLTTTTNNNNNNNMERENENEEEDHDESFAGLTKSTSGLVRGKASSAAGGGGGGVLSSGTLEVIRVQDANARAYGKAPISGVSFQPGAVHSSPLLFASSAKTLNLFQIDGRLNPLVQSVVLPDPIFGAAFSADGQEIIMTCRKSVFFVYDVAAGKVNHVSSVLPRTSFNANHRNHHHRATGSLLGQLAISPDGSHMAMASSADGVIMLLSSKSKQVMGDLKMNGQVSTITFTPDGRFLYAAGNEGRVYIWDVRSHRCLSQFVDSGSVGTTALAISKGYHWIACGQESGMVNLYDSQQLFGSSSSSSASKEPVKSFPHLVTGINHLKFSSDSQVLAMSSFGASNAIKLVHVPSMTVFSNWPSIKSTLGRITSLDWSPTSQYLACGSKGGAVQLFQLPYYS